MYSKTVEIWVGIFVAAGLAALFMLAMQVSNLSTVGAEDGYEISLYFEDIAGLGPRAPVRMSGVRIGRVSSIAYDQQRFKAVVKVQIENSYNTIPEDTTALILT
ncbi:MAG: MlaD family protein, partial [Gammaproteobacteria bacterium]|nr:MlaD family protein [Gammaproteobacteria bacterium]